MVDDPRFDFPHLEMGFLRRNRQLQVDSPNTIGKGPRGGTLPMADAYWQLFPEKCGKAVSEQRATPWQRASNDPSGGNNVPEPSGVSLK